MKSKKLILVNMEHTFELFESIGEAFDFSIGIKDIKSIDLVVVNTDYIFYEDGRLNYDDCSELIKSGILRSVY